AAAAPAKAKTEAEARRMLFMVLFLVFAFPRMPVAPALRVSLRFKRRTLKGIAGPAVRGGRN
ncbi:MAG: hypothetical protein RI538_09605, partial [Salibaculum sp.]|uniref:hypothetical protein n=1 Tax=Salibaculum sp. TaxID=2855480 RepID=UPI00286FF4BE